MNTFTLQVRLRRAEGALVRLLGLVGRRGFEAERVTARPSEDGARLDVTLQIRGTRPVEILARQLARLHDVEECVA